MFKVNNLLFGEISFVGVVAMIMLNFSGVCPMA